MLDINTYLDMKKDLEKYEDIFDRFLRFHYIFIDRNDEEFVILTLNEKDKNKIKERIEFLEKSYSMWTYLAENGCDKKEYFKINQIKEIPINGCYLCEMCSNNKYFKRLNCTYCMVFGNTRNYDSKYCLTQESPYVYWEYSLEYNNKVSMSKYAKEVAILTLKQLEIEKNIMLLASAT
jgi:hypothetical protein